MSWVIKVAMAGADEVFGTRNRSDTAGWPLVGERQP
jgi:hypothetical protein